MTKENIHSNTINFKFQGFTRYILHGLEKFQETTYTALTLGNWVLDHQDTESKAGL